MGPGSPDLAGDVISLRLVDIDDGNGRALAGQFVRRRRANTAGTSGHDRDFSGKSGHRILPLAFQ